MVIRVVCRLLGNSSISGTLPDAGYPSEFFMIFRNENTAVSGTLPELFLHSLLLEVRLSENRFSGTLHSTVHSLLLLFRLESNQVSGSIPGMMMAGEWSNSTRWLHDLLDTSPWLIPADGRDMVLSVSANIHLAGCALIA